MDISKDTLIDLLNNAINVNKLDNENRLDNITDIFETLLSDYEEEEIAYQKEQEYFDRQLRYLDDPFGIDARSPFGDEASTKDFWLEHPDLLDSDFGDY